MQTSIEVVTDSDPDADAAIARVKASVNGFLTGFDASEVVSIIPQLTESTDAGGVIWTRYTVTVVLKTEA